MLLFLGFKIVIMGREDRESIGNNAVIKKSEINLG
jgi:hypothetical protein